MRNKSKTCSFKWLHTLSTALQCLVKVVYWSYTELCRLVSACCISVLSSMVMSKIQLLLATFCLFWVFLLITEVKTYKETKCSKPPEQFTPTTICTSLFLTFDSFHTFSPSWWTLLSIHCLFKQIFQSISTHPVHSITTFRVSSVFFVFFKSTASKDTCIGHIPQILPFIAKDPAMPSLNLMSRTVDTGTQISQVITKQTLIEWQYAGRWTVKEDKKKKRLF